MPEITRSQILIVDDSSTNRLLLSEILSGHGHSVQMAINGEEALTTILTSPPDLIILDVLLPDIDGYEVCQRLQVDEHTRDIPVLFISGLHAPEDKVKAFMSGGVDYITKPFEPEEVLARVQTHLKLYHLTQTLQLANAQLAHREEAIHQSQIRYRNIFEGNVAVKLLIDPESGLIVDANTAATEFYGYTLEELKTLRIQDINLLTDSEIKAEMARAKNEQRKVFNFRHRLANGEVRDVQVFSGPVILDNKQHLYSIILDVTSQKQAETALRKSESRHRALLNAIPDLMFINRRDGTYLDYHASNPGLLFAPPEYFIGKTIKEILPGGLAQIFTNHLEFVLDTGNEHHYEYPLLVDGQTRYFEMRMTLAGNDEVLSIVRDITERKQVQQHEFMLALERERGHLLRQFIEKASHEFRTPLSVINTSAFLIARTEDSDARSARMLTIEEQVNRIKKLVDMLLKMSRLASDVVLSSYTSVNIHGLIQGVCQNLSNHYHHKPTLYCQMPATLPIIEGNADDLAEAFTQILDNAYRFTPPDGRITLTGGADEMYAWVSITDTGVGISCEDLPYVFETFWRKDEAHTTPGLGIGLAIAHKIIEVHRGDIEVQSTVGKGSSFTVRLPLTTSRNAESSADAM